MVQIDGRDIYDEDFDKYMYLYLKAKLLIIK